MAFVRGGTPSPPGDDLKFQSTSLTSDAIAKSGAGAVHHDHHGNNGWGNGGGGGSPNGKDDSGR
ncbi:hypothetical protein E4K64_27850 [Bradyrhizobium frederickii]|uniref:Uncharacterized protein n=1 Tax=Bradyrhizobium frederickii TaxID=2560054 RepID=A0A4Y9NVF0_9BRAD|nr:hypothetical protein E4K64_27850 [Bradyrhizobium frederickii]